VLLNRCRELFRLFYFRQVCSLSWLVAERLKPKIKCTHAEITAQLVLKVSDTVCFLSAYRNILPTVILRR
jgi:hypothetical protein